MATRELIQQDVCFNLTPAKPNERVFGMVDLLAIQICFGIAAWFFLTGSQTGLYLPAKEAIPTILFGNCFPLFLLGVMGLSSARYGVEQITSSIGVFGQKFSDVVLVLYLISVYPATAVATLLFGQSAIKFTSSLGGPQILGIETPGVTIWAIVALAIGSYIAFLGPAALKWFTRLSALFMMLILIGFIVFLLKYHGLTQIFSAKPAEPIIIPNDPKLSMLWSRASALEVNVGLGFSWAYWFGQWTRLAKTETTAYHGCFWGWGLLAAVAGVFSALAALAMGVYDPTLWIVNVGSAIQLPLLSIVGLLLMALANITSVATLVYPAAISIRSRYPKSNWILSLAIGALPALILFSPKVFYAIDSVYSFIGLLSGIYGAIVVADYWFVRRGKFNIRAMYDRINGYQYYKGYNPAAVIAVIIGFVFYVTTLNPLTWNSANGLFPYISAGLPTFFITALTYTMVMHIWVAKKYPDEIMGN